ncbi:hypothetical protein BGZ47_007532 [Haplosporangium gracile]|nr:hypothetical protein BGZ47_007532 [Haplosporangium gracile]
MEVSSPTVSSTIPSLPMPTLSLSSFGQVQTDWDTVILHFIKKHPDLAFDNRGIGLSTVTNDSFVTRQSMGNDIHELAKHFGWTHINLVGISMGAIVSNTLYTSKLIT